MLNADQERGKQFLINWWNGNQAYAVLEAPAGFGKTFMVLELIKSLTGCLPLFTAPTNEAVKQLREIIGDATNLKGEPYTIRTTYSALGYGFSTKAEKEELLKVRVPTELEHYNLLLVDEASMLGMLFEDIRNTGMRVLYIGHRNQLPEVDVNLSVSDKCESVVFKQKYPIYTLTTPVRNKGKLFKFCSHLENLIDSKIRLVKRDYDISHDEFENYIERHSKVELASEYCKIIGWSNKTVDKLNVAIRSCIFGKHIKPFLPSDKIIVTQPCLFIGKIDNATEAQLIRNRGNAHRITSNHNFMVRRVRECEVLDVPCYALAVMEGDQPRELFVPKNIDDYEELCKVYLHRAYSKEGVQATTRAFQLYHYIRRLFAFVKHSYAITTHRSQGMTVPKVIVCLYDIAKCENVYLKHKLLYVAASRAGKELSIVR